MDFASLIIFETEYFWSVVKGLSLNAQPEIKIIDVLNCLQTNKLTAQAGHLTMRALDDRLGAQVQPFRSQYI